MSEPIHDVPVSPDLDVVAGTARPDPKLLEGLPGDKREMLLQRSKVVSRRPGASLCRAGDSVDTIYWLQQGAMKRYVECEGASPVLAAVEAAPALFGHVELLARRSHSASYVAAVQSELLATPAEVFSEVFLDASGGVPLGIVDDVVATTLLLSQQLARRTVADAELRLRFLLAEYASKVGRPAEGGVMITARIHQEGLAADLGVSRQTVVRAMRRLRAHGSLRKTNGRYIVAESELHLVQPGEATAASRQAG